MAVAESATAWSRRWRGQGGRERVLLHPPSLQHSARLLVADPRDSSKEVCAGGRVAGSGGIDRRSQDLVSIRGEWKVSAVDLGGVAQMIGEVPDVEPELFEGREEGRIALGDRSREDVPRARPPPRPRARQPQRRDSMRGRRLLQN